MKPEEYLANTMRLETSFTPENQEYFKKLRSYLNAASFFYDEKEVKSQIYQLAVDLHDAQSHGETAVEYFGDDPKGMANQLIKGFKKESKVRLFKFVGGMVLLTWFAFLITTFQNEDTLTINLWQYLVLGVASTVLIFSFFLMLRYSIYDTRSKLFNKLKKNHTLRSIALWFSFILILSITVAFLYFLPKNAVVQINPPADLILISGISILITLGIVIKRVSLTYPFLILLWGWTIPGILRRIPRFHPYFIGEHDTMIFLIILWVTCLGFAFAFSYIAKKELKKYNIPN